MRSGWKRWEGWKGWRGWMGAVLATAVSAHVPAAGAQTSSAGPSILLSSGRLDGTAERALQLPAREQVMREIDDPHTGARWLLLRSQDSAGGPGRLVMAAGTASNEQRGGPGSAAPEPIVPRPVIRAGDRLVVEEHSAVVEARLEAVALGPAAVGSTFHVRLSIGGKLLQAVAVARGRAALVPDREVKQ